MLIAAAFDSFAVPIVDLYEKFAQSVINDIARRIIEAGVPTASAAWQMQRLVESGSVYMDIVYKVSRLTGTSRKELASLFELAGVRAIKFDDSIYKAAGLSPIPLNLSPAMVSVLQAGLEKTNGIIRNLTMSTASAGQKLFTQGADLAYMQVIQGGMSYDSAIRSAVKLVGSSGLEVLYPTGHKDKLDVAMRRAVLTGIGQTTAQLQLTRADQMNQDLVQVTAHGGARPSHALWQGQIFSRSGGSKQYPNFVASTGYGTGPGLNGWNCRHSFYPFFEGISENAYKAAEVEEMNNRVVLLDGEKVPLYEATQAQRAIERKIRYWKRQRDVLASVGLDNGPEVSKVSQWQAEMRRLLRETHLRRQGARERV